MAFKPPPVIVQKVVAFKAIKHEEDGGLSLWGIPIVLNDLKLEVITQNLMGKEFGEKKVMEVLYNLGKLQAVNAVKTVMEKYGYAKSIPEKKKSIEFNVGQLAMIGRGQYETIKCDLIKNIVIFKGKSPFATRYKQIFSLQKKAVDFLARGLLAGGTEYLIGKKVLCIETKCIANGKPSCEFTVKPVEDWDKNDPLVKEQIVEEIKEIFSEKTS